MCQPVFDAAFMLCFRSLFDAGRCYAFPCDEAGRVDLDALDDRSLNRYLYARALIGREVRGPVVQACDAA